MQRKHVVERSSYVEGKPGLVTIHLKPVANPPSSLFFSQKRFSALSTYLVTNKVGNVDIQVTSKSHDVLRKRRSNLLENEAIKQLKNPLKMKGTIKCFFRFKYIGIIQLRYLGKMTPKKVQKYGLEYCIRKAAKTLWIF